MEFESCKNYVPRDVTDPTISNAKCCSYSYSNQSSYATRVVVVGGCSSGGVQLARGRCRGYPATRAAAATGLGLGATGGGDSPQSLIGSQMAT